MSKQEEIINKVKRYSALSQKIQQLNKQRKELNQELFNDLVSERRESIVVGNLKADIYKRVKGFDRLRFKNEHPRLYDKYYCQDKSFYLRVVKTKNI